MPRCRRCAPSRHGSLELTDFKIQAPERFAYQAALNGRTLGGTIIVGGTEWTRSPGQAGWQASSYGAQPFSAAGYLDWWASYTQSPRLLDLYDCASTSPTTGSYDCE